MIILCLYSLKFGIYLEIDSFLVAVCYLNMHDWYMFYTTFINSVSTVVFYFNFPITWPSVMAQQVKKSICKAGETGDSDLILEEDQEGQEDPLEEEMATHSSILAWRKPDRLSTSTIIFKFFLS